MNKYFNHDSFNLLNINSSDRDVLKSLNNFEIEFKFSKTNNLYKIEYFDYSINSKGLSLLERTHILNEIDMVCHSLSNQFLMIYKIYNP
jgi:hypothetical protein